MRKKIVALLMCTTLVFGGAVSTYANTTTYNVTCSRDSSKAKYDDNISLKTKKDGGNAYESCFYVSPKYFSDSVAKMQLHSVRDEYRDRIISDRLVISKKSVGKKKHASYDYRVASGKFYRLVAGYYTGKAASIHSDGRYTP